MARGTTGPAEASHAADTALTTSATDTPQNAISAAAARRASGAEELARGTTGPAEASHAADTALTTSATDTPQNAISAGEE